MKPTAEQFEEALNQLLDEYDAFYFENKYGENTHKKQFDTLKQLEGENVTSALLWIMHRYDCHYKEEIDHDPVSSPIGYLESLIKAKKEKEEHREMSKREKALLLLLNWAEECGFGYDNFPEEYERYKDDIEEMGYIEGMIYIAEREVERMEKENATN